MIELIYFFVVLFPIYGVIAMIIILAKRLTIKKNLVEPLEVTEFTQKAAQGKLGVQKFSLILSVILTLFPVLCGLTAISTVDDYILILFFAIIPLTIVTIIANAAWVYPTSIVTAEENAFKTSTHSPLLRLERVLAWIVWIIYTALGLVVSLGLVFSIAL